MLGFRCLLPPLLEVRKEWLSNKYDTLKNTKTRERVWQKIDKNKGELMSFGTLVESFGILYCRDTAIAAAVKHASKCLAMKGPWLHYDTMAEIPLFMKMKLQYSEIMAEAWKLCEEESKTGSTSSSSGQGSSGKAGGVIAKSRAADDAGTRQASFQTVEKGKTSLRDGPGGILGRL